MTIYAVSEELKGLAGRIVSFTAEGSIPLEPLREAWQNRGLDTSLLPTGRTDAAAAKKALQDIVKGSRMLVRPLEGEGYTLVQERADGEVVSHHQDLIVIPVPGATPDITVKPETDPRAEKLREAYRLHLGELSNERIGVWVWRTLAPTVDAVSVFGGKGVYFVPRHHLDRWDAYREAVRQVAPGIRFFGIPAMQDEGLVETVMEGVRAEAAQAVKAMQDDLALSGDERLGKRALESRVDRTLVVRQKVERYEELLNLKLPAIMQELDGLRENIAAALLREDVAKEAA